MAKFTIWFGVLIALAGFGLIYWLMYGGHKGYTINKEDALLLLGLAIMMMGAFVSTTGMMEDKYNKLLKTLRDRGLMVLLLLISLLSLQSCQSCSESGRRAILNENKMKDFTRVCEYMIELESGEMAIAKAYNVFDVKDTVDLFIYDDTTIVTRFRTITKTNYVHQHLGIIHKKQCK